MPLSRLRDDSLEGLGVAFSGLSVGALEGKEKERVVVDKGFREQDPGDESDPSHEVPFHDKPSESAPSASDHPAAPSPTTTTLQATHQATSSPTTTPPLAEGLGFTGMPYLPHLWCELSCDGNTYGNCSQQTSCIQLHLHRYP